jgi:hypothetical protein
MISGRRLVWNTVEADRLLKRGWKIVKVVTADSPKQGSPATICYTMRKRSWILRFVPKRIDKNVVVGAIALGLWANNADGNKIPSFLLDLAVNVPLGQLRALEVLNVVNAGEIHSNMMVGSLKNALANV